MNPRPTQTALGRRAKFKVGAVFPARLLFFVAGFVATPAFMAVAQGMVSVGLAVGFVLVVLAVCGLFALPRTIEVGADGILLRSVSGKRRFIPIAILEHVSPTGRRGVRLRYYNGAEEILDTGSRADVGSEGLELREQLYAELLDAMAAWSASDSSTNTAARVARGTRSMQQWAELLRTMREGGGDYRSSEMRDEDLWLVLESGAHPEDSRAAAAVILRERGDVARARIRVAAEASASPRLRVAFEAASDPRAREDEEILAALEEAPASKRKKTL